MGNVGQNPETRHFSGGGMVTNLSLATSKKYKDKQGELREETEWHNLEAWNKTAEILDKYVKKGSRLYVEGELRTQSWETESGEKKYKTVITIRDFSMMSAPQGQAQAAKPEPIPATPTGPGPFDQDDDDLPF